VKGTIDQLIRLQEIITYMNEKKGPWLAFIDIQEAFERVCHTGLFYRLWKAGIKGKAWRVTKDMYTDMNAFVRTNHGDTEHFPIKIGVLQGSVLSAILFLIFIDPLILALRPYGTDIAGKKIASLMFADDLDLIADTQEKREKQTTITVKFLRDWRAIMNSPKSRYLSPLKTKQKNEHGIEETDEVTNLGVEVTTKEVFTTKHALKKTQNAIASMRYITNKLALQAGGTSITIALDIYQKKLAARVEYAIELSNPESHRVTILDNAQLKFIKQSLSLKHTTIDKLLQAETGMVQAKYRAAGKIICKYQQILIRNDEMTVHLLKTNKHNKSGFYQRYKASLNILELEHLKGTIQDQGTEALKLEIREKILIAQRKETLQHINTRITPHYEKHNKEWAPEYYLTSNWPEKHKLAYLHLRTFSHRIKPTKKSLLCPACSMLMCCSVSLRCAISMFSLISSFSASVPWSCIVPLRCSSSSILSEVLYLW
jgi:hypothetical protein